MAPGSIWRGTMISWACRITSAGAGTTRACQSTALLRLQHDGLGDLSASLANAVRYAHAVTRRPVLITEHGLCTDRDGLRASFIPAALAELGRAIGDGVPVLGYMHWSLIDTYEWIFG